MIKRIAYIGVAVKNIEKAKEKFTENLGSRVISARVNYPPLARTC